MTPNVVLEALDGTRTKHYFGMLGRKIIFANRTFHSSREVTDEGLIVYKEQGRERI